MLSKLVFTLMVFPGLQDVWCGCERWSRSQARPSELNVVGCVSVSPSEAGVASVSSHGSCDGATAVTGGPEETLSHSLEGKGGFRK